MLGKLIKHEFKATYKIMLLLIGILVIFGIVSYFLGTWFVGLGQNDIDNEFYAALVGVSMFGTTTLIFVSFISINMIGLIYLVIRFYKTMYTQEGYLTFTLPVTVSQITNAKLISAVIWEIIMTCINILTVVVFVLGICTPLDVSLYEIFDELIALKLYNVAGWIIMFITTMLITPISAIATPYFCITVGQLWQKHKIIGSILAYGAFYFVNQIASTVIMIFSGYFRAIFNPNIDDDYVFSMLTKTTWVSLVYAIVVVALCILGCHLIPRKRINLD